MKSSGDGITVRWYAMSKIEQPFLVLDANAHYAGFRTRPLNAHRSHIWVKFVTAVGLILAACVTAAFLVYEF